MTLSNLLLTTKQQAHLTDVLLACGAVLSNVTVGFETYGTLSAAADNAVLVCHHFSGTSHAAGRYSAEDAVPGWWDAVIGPGKAIDTDRWYVVAIDALGCIRVDAPHGVTTGPASLNPATGQPFGPDFPKVTLADMVETQRRVLDQLGVGRLAAAVGPSLGAMQAMEWATRRPREVDRVIAAIGLAELQPREHGLYRAMENAIRLDPAFRGGRYDPDVTPQRGLTIAIQLMMLLAGGAQIPGAPDHRDDAFEGWLEREARARASVCDANAMIAMLRCNTHWQLGGGPLKDAAARISARVLLLPGLADALLPMESYHTPLVEALKRHGVDLCVEVLPATHGHLAGLAEIGYASDAIRSCLERPCHVHAK